METLSRESLLSCFVSGHDFTACGKTPIFEGYGLQPVRKWLQTGPALAAEGTHFHPAPTFSASCLVGPKKGQQR
jgi:hypothetical protein